MVRPRSSLRGQPDRPLGRVERAGDAPGSRRPRGRARIVLVEGEAGVGKSRLVDEFLRTVVADGATVLRGRGYDATAGMPFAPVVEALRGALDAPGLAGTDPEWLTEAARLLPELRQRFPGLAEPELAGRPGRCLAAATRASRSWSARPRRRAAAGDLGGRSAVVRRGQLQADPVPRPAAGPGPILWLGTTTLGELERDAPAARLCRTLRAKAGRRDDRALRSGERTTCGGWCGSWGT